MWEHFAPGGPIRVAGHHLADRFVRAGGRVAWLAGPLSPINFVRRNDEIDSRLRLWRRGGEWREGGRLFAYAPLTLLPHRPRPLFDAVVVARRTLRFTAPPWGGVLKRAGFSRFDLLFMEPGSPFTALLRDLPHERSVFRMSDDTAAFPDAPRTHARLEAEAVRRCDLVVAPARLLAARAAGLGARRVLHLPNGCDPEPFDRPGLPEPADLAPWPRPRAIYAGSIDWWFDAELVRAVARRLPRWSFILIGPVRGRAGAALAGLPNVVLLGGRPYESLPSYFAHADAGIVPFVPGPMTHAIHPIKVYEYLAAGLPVVATPMRETAEMGAPIRLAEAPAGFAEALAGGLADDGVARGARRAFARANTWDARFEALSRALDLPGVPAVRRAATGGTA